MLQHHKDKPAAWYREKLKVIGTERQTVQRNWSVKNMPAFSERHQWYKALIELDETHFCNSFLGRMAMETDAGHKHYLWYEAMEKIVWLMKEVQSLPSRLAELTAYPDGGLAPVTTERLKLEDQHILEHLKACLAGLYLELQAVSPKPEARFPVLDEQSIYRYHYLEASPAESLLMPASVIVLPLPAIVQPEAFVPLRTDRPHQARTKISFADIIDTEKLFALEANLYDYALIDNHSRFVKNKARSHNRLMAVVYHVIAEAGIFRKTILGSKVVIAPKHIQSYLDVRYQANLSQEFRKVTDDSREFAFLKLPFLERDHRFRKYTI